MNEICIRVSKESGIEIDTARSLFELIKNPSNQTIIQGRVFYHGPISPTSPRQWPRIKFDLTSDEVIVNSPKQRDILHSYSDYKQIENFKVRTYDFHDLYAEKIRALFERTRPRDLYDVVEIYERKGFDRGELLYTLKEKCHFKRIYKLELSDYQFDVCNAGWRDQLSKQLPKLPSFHDYVMYFKLIYKKLELDKLFN